MEDFNPNRKVSVVYLCSQTGFGMEVEVEKEAHYIQKAVAEAMVFDCENSGGCPENCQIRMLLDRRI